jgi:hypothetical protein
VTHAATQHTGVPQQDPAVAAHIPELQQLQPGALQELINSLSMKIAEGTITDDDKAKLKAASIVTAQRQQV